ncbi:ankyrin repeat domain-containing protein [Maribacter luteus]|uniref:Ankyrin repeat domain-containing protein n=1 Tax=Maribacter luteus TaxID=2594478 RepID=A0A6I2MHJ3_9FLAO|nr:ankyrin repeat domain-containing protein [Maribacter luteus]MRX63283.1 ankyrin repeat domain-containing protein [Maribacter luteus]
MRKSVIAFGILFSVMINTVSANNKPTDNSIRSFNMTTKNVAPISIAVVQNDYKTVEKFLELGSNVEAKSKTMGMTPIMYAARYNNVEMLQLLVANGADFNVKSKMGLKAIQYAELSNATEAVAFLDSL